MTHVLVSVVVPMLDEAVVSMLAMVVLFAGHLGTLKRRTRAARA